MNQTHSTQSVPGSKQSDKYLTFRLKDESYAMSVTKVCEIIQTGKNTVTSVPQTPAYIRGVINLRGRVIPVVNLRARFEMESAADTEQTCTVVVQTRDARYGIVVDRVEEVAAISAEDLGEVPDFGAAVRPEYLLGMARTKGGVRSVLDIDRILGRDELQTLTRHAA